MKTQIPTKIRHILQDLHDQNMEYLEECALDYPSVSEFLSDHVGSIKEIKGIRKFLGGMDPFNPISLWIEVNSIRDATRMNPEQEAKAV